MRRAKTTWTLRLDIRKASAADCKPTVYMAWDVRSLLIREEGGEGQRVIDASFNWSQLRAVNLTLDETSCPRCLPYKHCCRLHGCVWKPNSAKS